jgi:hypothetical protein
MKIKRTGLVYSLYLKNLIHLWIVAGILLAMFVSMIVKSHDYLANYLIYRRQPDTASLTAFLEPNQLDLEEVYQNIQENGGEAALYRQETSMFFLDNVYQEGSRYRFTLSLDPSLLTDTGIYYDDAYTAYTGITDREEVKALVPRENYLTEHLYFYDYEGYRLVLAMDNDLDYDYLAGDLDSLRVTFAPLSIYSLYMAEDLYDAGYRGEINNFIVDCRKTPVDFEDDDFKDLVMLFPFMLLALIPSLLFTICPVLHPTYHQLNKFARSTQKAVDQVDANFAEFGIVSEDGKTLYLEDWLIKRSMFKTGIEKNWKKQMY